MALASALLISLLADQAAKAWALEELGGGRHVRLVGDVFQLRLVRNSGSAFGLAADWPLVIFLLNLGIMAFVAVWAMRASEAGTAFGLVLGGGLGNLADRVFRAPGMGFGEVVDFIYLSFWPTFNLADSAIVIGVALLMLKGPGGKEAS